MLSHHPPLSNQLRIRREPSDGILTASSEWLSAASIGNVEALIWLGTRYAISATGVQSNR